MKSVSKFLQAALLTLSLNLFAEGKKSESKLNQKLKSAQAATAPEAKNSDTLIVQNKAHNLNEKIYKLQADQGKVEFVAVGKPAMIKINGEGLGPEGDLIILNDQNVNSTLILDLNQLTTKIDLRDDHMKNKYLEVQKYPKAILSIKDLLLKTKLSETTDQNLTQSFNGNLELHGKTNPVSGDIKYKKVKNEIIGEASFSFKIMEHLDTLPSWAGIKVADDVKVNVQFKFNL